MILGLELLPSPRWLVESCPGSHPRGQGQKGPPPLSVLQEVDKAGWEDTSAGAVALNEANLGCKDGGSGEVGVPSWAEEKLWG